MCVCVCVREKLRGNNEHSMPLDMLQVNLRLNAAGESNAGRYQQYSCQIQAMVSQWRVQFHQHSMQQTSDHFPFGYVQVS